MNEVIVTLYAGNSRPDRLAELANDQLMPLQPARVTGNRVEVVLSKASWDLLPKGPLKVALNAGGFSTAFNVQPSGGVWWDFVGRAYTAVLSLIA